MAYSMRFPHKQTRRGYAIAEEIDRLRAALIEIRGILGIKPNFVPLGPAISIAPIISKALGESK